MKKDSAFSLPQKRASAKSRKDAVYYAKKLFSPGETVSYCEMLPRDNFLSPRCVLLCLGMGCVFAFLGFFRKIFPTVLQLLFLACFLFFAYHALIRLIYRGGVVVTSHAVYLYLPTIRKRVYRMKFSEIKEIRVRNRWFSRSKKRFFLYKKQFTLCNSPYWKLVRFKRTKDVSELDFIDYAFFHCYSPLFMQLVKDEELLAVFSEMKTISRSNFTIK